jgi:hypothetical protein
MVAPTLSRDNVIILKQSQGLPLTDRDWIPTPEQVEEAIRATEQEIAKMTDKSPGVYFNGAVEEVRHQLSAYYVQALGKDHKGERFVVLHLIAPGPVADGWKTGEILVCDGGSGFVDVWYNISTRKCQVGIHGIG